MIGSEFEHWRFALDLGNLRSPGSETYMANCAP